MTRKYCSRRKFLGWAATATASGLAACSGDLPAPGSHSNGAGGGAGAGGTPGSTGGVPSTAGASGDPEGGSGGEEPGSEPNGTNPRVSLVRCRSYAVSTVTEALQTAFDQIGGIDSLVNGKTVTVKVNLTGTAFEDLFGLPPGETYITHGSTAVALAALLVRAGARRVRFVESAAFALSLPEVMVLAGWDVNALAGVGAVEFENTRNLGSGNSYARLFVPDGGRLYSYFEVNQAYIDTDVFISLAKMKQHVTAGVTLSLKNLFGIPPNSLYSNQIEAGEAALGHRAPMHDLEDHPALPGEISGYELATPGVRVPRITTDLCLARPIHLAIIDGITSMRGGEGPWNPNLSTIEPGVLVVGSDPVATDAVAAATMGYDPRAWSLTPAQGGENHLLLAEAAGIGSAALDAIDVVGLTLAEARHPF